MIDHRKRISSLMSVACLTCCVRIRVLLSEKDIYPTQLKPWMLMHWRRKEPEPWFNIKMSSYQYRKPHYGDKTVVRSSYLHNGISYTGKMSSLYWISPQHIRDRYIDYFSSNILVSAPESLSFLFIFLIFNEYTSAFVRTGSNATAL